VYDSERNVEDDVGHLRKEGGRHEHLSYSVPLQLTDERIRFDHGSPERLRRHHFPAVSTRYDDRRRAKGSIADEQSSTILGNLRHDRMQRVGYGRKVLRNHELHSVGRRLEENFRSEFSK
jgi:hypothetical protein